MGGVIRVDIIRCKIKNNQQHKNRLQKNFLKIMKCLQKKDGQCRKLLMDKSSVSLNSIIPAFAMYVP